MVEQVLLPHLVAAMEAIAAVRAVSFAKEIGLNFIVLEGDSEIIINSLKSDEVSLLKDTAVPLLFVVYIILKDRAILLLITLPDMLAILQYGKRMFLLT